MNLITQAANPREQHGFQRTQCACEFCHVPCKHLPGALDPADLNRLCPPEENVFVWAEEHLRALTTRSYPVLVPARQSNGHCHWLIGGMCAVHENSPYGCAFFDVHMSKEESDRRAAPTINARKKDAEENGVYEQVWRHLRQKGLVADSKGRAGWREEVRKMVRNAERRFKGISCS